MNSGSGVGGGGGVGGGVGLLGGGGVGVRELCECVWREKYQQFHIITAKITGRL